MKTAFITGVILMSIPLLFLLSVFVNTCIKLWKTDRAGCFAAILSGFLGVVFVIGVYLVCSSIANGL
jgi:hypothetical protein